MNFHKRHSRKVALGAFMEQINDFNKAFSLLQRSGFIR